MKEYGVVLLRFLRPLPRLLSCFSSSSSSSFLLFSFFCHARQAQYEAVAAVEGPVHVPSWGDPHVCAGDQDVHGVLARYSFIPTHGEHAALVLCLLGAHRGPETQNNQTL